MLLAQSGAEATILTSLWRSWKMIANQTDRYVATMKKDAARPRRAMSEFGAKAEDISRTVLFSV
jgi:hypothetical protein